MNSKFAVPFNWIAIKLHLAEFVDYTFIVKVSRLPAFGSVPEIEHNLVEMLAAIAMGED
jgi:hypothetical protein